MRRLIDAIKALVSPNRIWIGERPIDQVPETIDGKIVLVYHNGWAITE